MTAVALSGNSVAPGTLGFLVVFGMAVVLTLLFRSMTKHLRKVNKINFDDQPVDPTKAAPPPSPRS